MARQLLIENMPFQVALEEDKDKPGRYFARGEYARHDRPTENKRFYRAKLWEREIGRLDEAMHDRRVFGELDHPADGRTKLQRVSHLLTGLSIKNDGMVFGESEIMDTPNGRILKAILDAGAKVGVSSRGFGSTKPTTGGIEEVQDDFQLQTFDFVADPATKTAYPAIFQEELAKIPEEGMELTLEGLKKDYPGLVVALLEETRGSGPQNLVEAVALAEERTEKRLTEKFSAELRRQLEQVETSAKEKAFSEALSDPSVAGAKVILERIASLVTSFGVPPDVTAEMGRKDEEIAKLKAEVVERELEVQKSQREAQEIAKIAKEATYRLHLERLLSTNESRDAIIALIGDVTGFKNIQDMESRVEAVVEELSKAAREKEQVSAQQTAASHEVEERLSVLETKVAEESKARQAAEDALKVAQEEKERANERAMKALAIAEEMQKSMTSQIEEAVEDVKTATTGQHPALDADQAERIRARLSRGKERSIVEDTTGTKDGKRKSDNGASETPLMEFGLTEEVFDKFAGVEAGK